MVLGYPHVKAQKQNNASEYEPTTFTALLMHYFCYRKTKVQCILATRCTAIVVAARSVFTGAGLAGIHSSFLITVPGVSHLMHAYNVHFMANEKGKAAGRAAE